MVYNNGMQMVKALAFDTEKDGWEKSKGFTMREVPMPILDEANPNDAVSVILKVKYAGFCGSDRGIWHRTAFKDMVHDSLKREGKTTRILGHEFMGEIVETGSMVERLYNDPDPNNKAKIQVGNLVSGDSHVTCGRCFQCRVGEQNVCLYDGILGITMDGIFAEYVKVPAKNLWAIDPDRIRPEIAAIYDPFGNAIHSATKVDFRGARVAIFGAGPIGLFSVLLARHFGAAKVIAIDVNDNNLKMAKELGAHEIIKIEKKQKEHEYDSDKEVIERIMQLTYGKGVDVSMEMAGPFSSVNNSIDATRRGGHVVFFGIKDGNLVIPKFSRVVVKGITIHNVIGREIFKTWQIAQRVLQDRSNGIQDAIWNVILKQGKGTIVPFSSYNKDTFGALLNEHPKLVFKVDG